MDVKLSPKERWALQFLRLGLTVDQIAQKMRTSEYFVGVLLTNAREKLLMALAQSMARLT